MGPSLLNQWPQSVMDPPDGELLRRYLTGRDSPALEALVRRHGGMVLGVCRRVLGDPHDAEDAFQATFLVFVRKAASVRPGGLLGPWLYGVATRTALKARALAARRRAREKQVDALPEVAAPAGPVAADWLPLLDREVAGLPAKYRLPILLCDLQGVSRMDAAEQLGICEGTLSSRLARARVLLRKRLSRRGVGTAVLAAAVLFPAAANAAPPPVLVASVVRAANAFAAGTALATPPALLAAAVLASWRRARLAAAGVVLITLAVLGGLGLLLARGGQPAAVVDTRTDQEKLQGKWVVVPEESWDPFGHTQMVFHGNEVDWPLDSVFVLDPTANPKQIRVTCQLLPPPKNFVVGIYEVHDSKTRFCFSQIAHDEFPTKFTPEPGSGQFLITVSRRLPAK